MKTKSTIRYFITLLAIICGLHLNLHAQISPNASTVNWDTLPYKNFADYKLELLNKSYITTGILYDRMLPIADIDGHLAGMTTPDTTFPDHFTQAYYEIYNSAYNTTGWVTPEQLDSLITARGNTAHPIGLFYYTFNVLDSNALQDHLVDTTANGQFCATYKVSSKFICLGRIPFSMQESSYY